MRTWPALEVGQLTSAATDAADLLQAALVDYSVTAIDETVADIWRVFFSSDAERNRAALSLTRQFPDLSLQPLDVPDEDWVARSQAGLRAVRIGNIIVAPPWDIPDSGMLQLDPSLRSATAGLSRPAVIVVRPSIGFGTGHHATTRLCLSALQRLDLRGRSAIDVGTGSGVLAIAAHRLGARPSVGIDNDIDAVKSATDNLAMNGDADVTFIDDDLRSVSPGSFDVVCANLTGALLIQTAGCLRSLAAPGAHLILSGFLRQEETDVVGAYSDDTVVHRKEEEDWVCVSMQRT